MTASQTGKIAPGPARWLSGAADCLSSQCYGMGLDFWPITGQKRSMKNGYTPEYGTVLGSFTSPPLAAR